MQQRSAAVAGVLWVALWAGIYLIALVTRVPAPPGYYEPRLNRVTLPVEYINDHTQWAAVVCPIAAALGLAWLWNRIGRDKASGGGRVIYWLLKILLPLGCLAVMVVVVKIVVEIGRTPFDWGADFDYFKDFDREKELEKERWIGFLTVGLVAAGALPLYLWLRRKLLLNGRVARAAKAGADPG